ncbi:MAG: ABC transporter substrate-binding protein [Oscillospiraceae bacterium]|nr:ABC transporter substrate-binding protein [Oscillospiraceae bacterium]
MKRCICALLALLCALGGACVFPEPVSERPPEEAPPVPAPPTALAPNTGQRYNDVFCLAWAPDAVEHPMFSLNRFNHDVYTLVYESLFTLDERFEPVFGLCAGYEYDGGGVFTLTLQNGVAFHDGEPLTAEDVVYSFAQARSAASPYAERLRGVSDVRAAGGETEAVVVTLREPNERLPALLTFPVVRRGSAGEAFPWAGTGPYLFLQPDGGAVSLELYTAWWKHGRMPLGHIELNALSGPDELPYMMGVGDVSAVVSDLGDGFGVGLKGDFAVWGYPTLILQYIGINAAHPLLADSRMRRALSAGIDRAALCAEVYGSDADPAALPIPPSSPLSGAAAGASAADLRLMTDLLEELELADLNGDGFLQYPVGRTWYSFTLRFLVEEDDGAACEAVRFICRALAEAGIDAEYTPLTRSAFAAALKRGDYELYCARENVPADFNLDDWARREGARVPEGASAPLRAPGAPEGISAAEAWAERMPAIPLLFRRQALVTRRGAADGVKPLFLRPFDNFSEWEIKK